MSKSDYVARLAGHDWFFDYSDDYSVYSRGHENYQALLHARKQFDPDGAIWNEYAPPQFRAKTPEPTRGELDDEQMY